MRNELKRLQAAMRRDGTDIWLIPCRDAHGSEYIGDRDKCTEALSGFTGDSCVMAVFKEEAYLWTDGRYFEQAEKELSGSGVGLMKMGEKGVPTLPDFLESRLERGQTLAFYAPLFSVTAGRSYRKLCEKKGASVRTNLDPAELFWENRPERSRQPVWSVPIARAGKTAAEKLEELRERMQKAGATVFFTGALDETAWITNLRGSDIACNPVFLSFFLLTGTRAVLFVQEEALSEKTGHLLESQGIETRPYDSLEQDLSELSGETVLLDPASTSYAVWRLLKERNILQEDVSPAALLKCVKNSTEQRGMAACHKRDGLYLTKFLYWLKKAVRSGKQLTEGEAAAQLDLLRSRDPRFVDLSFPTISAYGPNAAMAHYQAEAMGGAVLQKRGLYLVDSGAHYQDGTTDVTRTIALGPTTLEEKRHYTLTVIGMLRLMNAVFPEGVRGVNLDTFARAAMWREGVDFNHGTGHGVGCLNVVHEGPVAVRIRPGADPKRDLPFVPGMVTSDEPGVYVEGKHGVRTENLLLCVPFRKQKGFYAFRTLTLAPLDPAPLLVSMMTEQDRRQYNAYQRLVYRSLASSLTEPERKWLAHETREL